MAVVFAYTLYRWRYVFRRNYHKPLFAIFALWVWDFYFFTHSMNGSLNLHVSSPAICFA